MTEFYVDPADMTGPTFSIRDGAIGVVGDGWRDTAAGRRLADLAATDPERLERIAVMAQADAEASPEAVQRLLNRIRQLRGRS